MLQLGERDANELYGFALELAKHGSVGSVGIGRPQESPLAWDRKMTEMDPSDRAKVAVLLDVMAPGGALREVARPNVGIVKRAGVEAGVGLLGRLGRSLGLISEAAPGVARAGGALVPAAARTVATVAPEAVGATTRALPNWLGKTYQHFAGMGPLGKAMILGGAGYDAYLAQTGQISPLQAALGIGIGFAPIKPMPAIAMSLANVFGTPRLEQGLGLWTPPEMRAQEGVQQGYQLAQQDYQQQMAQQQQQLAQQQQQMQQQMQAARPTLWDTSSAAAAQMLLPSMPVGTFA